MKRLLIFSIVPLLALGCRSFSVVVADDPFTKTTVVTADMWHDTLDGKITNMRALYTKELKGNVFTTPELQLEFRGDIPGFSGYTGEKLEKKVEISLDERLFILYFDDTTYNDFKQAHSSYSSSSSSTGFSTSSSSGEWHWANLTATLKLWSELQKAILNSKTFLIRVYTGKYYTTLSASPAQMSALKDFLSLDVETVKKMKR
jgi:hypothetical protein